MCTQVYRLSEPKLTYWLFVFHNTDTFPPPLLVFSLSIVILQRIIFVILQKWSSLYPISVVILQRIWTVRYFWGLFAKKLETCQTKSTTSQVHDWVVYNMGALLGSVGDKDKIHKITPGTGKERRDLEIKDYVVLQKPHDQDNRLPPPHTLIADFTMTRCSWPRWVYTTQGVV